MSFALDIFSNKEHLNDSIILNNKRSSASVRLRWIKIGEKIAAADDNKYNINVVIIISIMWC